MPPRPVPDAAESDAVPRVGVERPEAAAALRVERVDRLVAPAADDADVGLGAGVGQPELVGPGEHVPLGLGPGVEALHLELVAPDAAAEVDAVVGGPPAAVPDAEVGELREARRAGRLVDDVGAEAVGDVVVVDGDDFEVEPQPVVDLPGVAERDLVGVRGGEGRRGDLVRGGPRAPGWRSGWAAAAGPAGRACRSGCGCRVGVRRGGRSCRRATAPAMAGKRIVALV